jgi:hypothetical protein
MVDKWKVHKLFRDYCWSVDYVDLDLLASVMTEDGSLEIEIKGADTVGPFTSRQAILDFTRDVRAGQGDARFHVFTNLAIEEAGDEIRANVFALIIKAADGVVTLQTAGVYRAEIVRDGDEYRIRRMHLTLEASF